MPLERGNIFEFAPTTLATLEIVSWGQQLAGWAGKVNIKYT